MYVMSASMVPYGSRKPLAILVTGGTGTLGRALVPLLTQAGHQVKVLSRRPRPAGTEPGHWATGDLRRGTGIAAAVAGAEVIVHCATSVGEVAAARNLVAVARQAGGPHLVYISIVGVDRIPFGYYKSKLATEQLIAASELPWTMLRATQFHNLIFATCAALARMPVLPLPAGFRFQPVEVTEVAARLVELAGAVPAGRVPDLGGPEIHPVEDLAASYLRAAGRRRRLLRVPLPGATAVAYRRGGNLAPEHAAGKVTFGEFLPGRFAAQAQAQAQPMGSTEPRQAGSAEAGAARRSGAGQGRQR